MDADILLSGNNVHITYVCRRKGKSR